MERLRRLPKVVGLKQSEKAIKQGRARQAFLAEDTDSWIAEAFVALCRQEGVPLTLVSSGKALAKACRVEVSTACAVLLDATTEES